VRIFALLKNTKKDSISAKEWAKRRKMGDKL
jgi:hypothetical protein